MNWTLASAACAGLDRAVGGAAEAASAAVVRSLRSDSLVGPPGLEVGLHGAEASVAGRRARGPGSCASARAPPRRDLQLERHADERAVHGHALQCLAGLELVVEVAVGGEHRTPVELVAHTAVDLPGELGLAGADVDVVRQEPLALGAEVVAALEADDGVPVGAVDAGLAAARAAVRLERGASATSSASASCPASGRRRAGRSCSRGSRPGCRGRTASRPSTSRRARDCRRR